MTTRLESDFLNTRYWPQLDGLRTLSILVVIVAHTGDTWWPDFRGALGVVLFFVISGFLITSLLIREERRKGSVSIKSFYVRRVFRIAPLYYLALGAATFLVLVGGFGSGPESFLERLPLLATFNGDFAIYGTFVHSWSIGIEEKFYILWPLVGFAALTLRRHRAFMIGSLLTFCTVSAYIPGLQYFGIYTAILAGCALAIAMHSPRGFAVVRNLAHPVVGPVLVVLAIAAFILDGVLPGAEVSGLAHVPFAFAVALAFPSLLLGTGWLPKVVGWKALAFIGTRTYGIYLFHPFCIDIVNRLLPPDQTSPGLVLFRLVVICTLAYAVSEVLFRTVERPMNRIGHRHTGKLVSERHVPTNEKQPA